MFTGNIKRKHWPKNFGKSPGKHLWTACNFSRQHLKSSSVEQLWTVASTRRKVSLFKLNTEETRATATDMFLLTLAISSFAGILCLSSVWVTIIDNFVKVDGGNNSADIYLFKVNDGNTRVNCRICWKLTIKTPERNQWRRLHC